MTRSFRLLTFSASARLLAVVFLLSPIFAQAQTQDAIGRVIRTTGVVSAVNAAGDERPLARGSEIFVDETINTGADGSTQLRLNDGALITLNEDSFFTVNEFEYDGPGGAGDTAIMTMVRGSLRTITGAISDDPADTYQLNTPFASIGVRGTEYAVVIDTTGRAWYAVFDGSISLQPAGGGGPTIVGLDGATDFVEMDDENTLVQLEEAAAELGIVIATVLEPVTEQDLASLPDPDDAVNQQLQQQQQQGETQTGTTDDQNNNDQGNNQQNTGGQLVDNNGNALNSTDENSNNQNRSEVVNSNPNQFDDSTKKSVSPNQ